MMPQQQCCCLRAKKSLAPYMETLAPDLVVTDDGVTTDKRGRTRCVHEPRRSVSILATSGSTADRKLVALPTSSIALHPYVMARDLDVSKSDRFQAAGPLTHAYGLLGGPIAALQHGATVLALIRLRSCQASRNMTSANTGSLSCRAQLRRIV